MFEFLPRLAVERPVLTSMMVLMALVLGIFGFTQLQTDLLPDIEFPIVTVSTVYPGAGPEEVETQVTEPIEEAVSNLANIDDLRSYSQENVSIIILQFDLVVDPDQAAIDVRDRIESIRADLPDETQPPTVQKFDIGQFPIMELAFSGPQATNDLYQYADEDLREQFSRVNGVASVDIVGGQAREVEVLVSPERLREYGVTLPAIVSMIGAENVSIPSGTIREPATDVPVRVLGEYRTVSELEELRLFGAGGSVVRLADVAIVRDGHEDLDQLARHNGEPAISISIQKRSDANPVLTSEGVRAEIDRLAAQLPPGSRLEVVRDQSEFIESSINDVLFNLLLGILLTTAVLFLFLHSWRGTVIAAVAMPVTVIATFLLIEMAGFTLNVMTLMALSITVGILVTNTIVVLETIYRHLDEGEDPRGAAWKGTTEIAVAVAASTLTNLVVFTPIAFMGGIIGQFFLAFGLTVVFATIFSIFISFTLAPLMAARLLRAYETKREETEGLLAGAWRRWDAWFDSVEEGYKRLLDWSLARSRNGWIVIGGIGALSIVGLVIAGAFVGGEFMPAGDEGGMQIELELPSGTPIRRTAEVAAVAEARLLEIPEVESTLTTIAGSGFLGIGGGANVATIVATLVDDAPPTPEILRRVRPMLADLPDVAISAVAIDPSSIGGQEAPIQLEISGTDYGTLRTLGERLTSELALMPELSNVTNSLDDPRTELVFRPDRATLADYGLTVGQVGNVVRTAFEGQVAGVFRGEVGEERDIRVRLVEDARDNTSELGTLQIETPVGSVPLSALGRVERATSPTAIQRVDRVRTVVVEAEIGGGSLTDATGAITQHMNGQPLPPGYTWRITGEFEQFADAVASILVALVLAITLTYIVLAMILESVIHPVTIMLTLPLGGIGAILALFLWGESLNIFSMMALVMLVGIVVNNAILILDYAGQLRRRGAELIEALTVAAPARLRAIVMSNIAIVVALIPQALATGSGATFRVPMAVVTIGGVLLAAVFTLVLIPVMYAKLDRFAFALHVHEAEERERLEE